MPKRKRNNQSSKCPEPINTLLDVAGAATLGMYVKHKVKKDYKTGHGEESAKAAAVVLGIGAMRGGSRGTISLGGLIGLNSAIKAIERQEAMNALGSISSAAQGLEKDSGPSYSEKAGIWRKHCEDGNDYGINPDDYANADDYADALYAAKAKKRIDNQEIESVIEEKEKDKQDKHLYFWRKYCEDGSQYGVNPEDFESADDYAEELKKAKKNYI